LPKGNGDFLCYLCSRSRRSLSRDNLAFLHEPWNILLHFLKITVVKIWKYPNRKKTVDKGFSPCYNNKAVTERLHESEERGTSREFCEAKLGDDRRLSRNLKIKQYRKYELTTRIS